MTSSIKLIATNPNAKREYFLEEVVEAGIVLTGTEIKSIRQATPNISDSYVEIRPTPSGRLEAWLVSAHIPPYTHGNHWNHDPLRKRKLLLHTKQIEKIHGAITRKGLTAVATKIYLSKGYAKLEVAVGKGKKAHDKRQDIQARAQKREAASALKKSHRGGSRESE